MAISNTQLSFKSTDKSYVVPTNIDGFNLSIDSYTYNSGTGEGTINFATGPKIVQGTGIKGTDGQTTGLSDGSDSDSVLKIIPENAFEGCSTLQEIEMPDSIEGIGSYAFKDCTNLESITMSGNIQSIGTGITSGCTKMLSEGQVIYKSKTYSENSELITSLGISIIDSDEKIIGSSSQPENELWYTTTDEAVLSLNTSFFDATVLSNTYENGKGVIKFNTNLTQIKNCTYGPGEPRVGAFGNEYMTSTLKTITLPQSITYIGKVSFVSCTQITNVYYKGTMSEFNTKAANFDSAWRQVSSITSVECSDGTINY